jgi:hypothetical protein
MLTRSHGRNTFLFAALLLLGTLNALPNRTDAFAKGATQKYFWVVDEDTRMVFVGHFPVDAALQSKANCYRMTYDENGVLTKIEYLKAGRLAYDPRYNTAMIVIEHEDGFEKRSFMNIWGRPQRCDAGYFSCRIKFDLAKHTGVIYTYDEFGDRAEDKDGAAERRFVLDKNGDILKALPFDANGERKMAAVGKYEVRNKANAKHQLIESGIYTETGEAIASADDGALRRTTYDPNGMPTEIRIFGPDEQLAGNQNIAITQYTWSLTGQQLARRVLDHHTKLLRLIEWTLDEFGNITEWRNFGPDGRLIGPGVAITKFTYDPFNNETSAANFDSSGKPVIDANGLAETRFGYDVKGHLIEIRHFGYDHKLTIDSEGNYAIEKLVRDGNEDMVEEQFLNSQEKLTLCRGGYAIRRNTWDAMHDQLSQSFFGVDTLLIDIPPYGIARGEWEYDETGIETGEDYYNTKDEEVEITDSTKDAFLHAKTKSLNVNVEGSYKNIDGQYSLEYDSRVWQVSEKLFPQGDLALLHFSGQCFALFLHRLSAVTLDESVAKMIELMKISANKVEMLSHETRSVHNHNVAFCKVEAMVKGQSFVYLIYLAKTRHGLVTITTGSVKANFPQHEAEMMTVLNAVNYSD